MDDMIFVLIFAFDPQGRVLLRMKTKECYQGEWQAGRWNGLGGKKNDLDEAAVRQRWAEMAGDWADTARMCAKRKLEEESGRRVSHHRFYGGIYVPYPQANLYVYWILLTNEEAAECLQIKGLDDVGELKEHQEYNRWFTTDEINDMANGDRVGMEEAGIPVSGNDWMVDSTWEFIELIKSLGHWFGN